MRQKIYRWRDLYDAGLDHWLLLLLQKPLKQSLQHQAVVDQ
jgi:hypothetical protein